MARIAYADAPFLGKLRVTPHGKVPRESALQNWRKGRSGAHMKAYLGTTGVIFALVTVLHLARSAEMWQRFASDPWFVSFYVLLTCVTAALSIWAWKLFPRLPRT